jgi:glutathione S-transferase
LEATLYVILGSHACRTGMLLLDHKGIPYRTVNLPTGLHPTALRILGFSGNNASFRTVDGETNRMLAHANKMGTVPALRIDGQRVKSNRGIARFLDELQPDPPLFPAQPEQRAKVEEAEAWGDESFQMAVRRLGLAAVRRDRAAAGEADSGRLGPMLWHSKTMRWAGSRMITRAVFTTDSEAEQRLRNELPAMLDRVDAWIESGVLNGEQLYAADLMIAPSLALLTYDPDTRAEIERRPALRLADRLLPDPVEQPTVE